MLANQFLTPEKLSKSAKKLAEELHKHPLEPGELMPMMTLNPSGGKLMMDIIVLKVEGEKIVFSRTIDSKELTGDYLIDTLSGITI